MTGLFRIDGLGTARAANRITAAGARMPRRGPLSRCGLAVTLGIVVVAQAAMVSARTPVLRLSEAWVRAMPPGQRMTAAYLRIENTGAAPAVIDGVEASVGNASVHETVRSDGRARMQARAQLEVPSGGAVALTPGGLHIMLTGLEKTPAEGDAVTLCVTGSAPRVCIEAPVLRDAPGADGRGGGMKHGHDGG